MRVGISLGTTIGPGDPRPGVASVIDQAQAALRAGLDSLTVGDHHSTGPGGYLQNTPLLGRLLAEWGDRPAGCLFLVPLWNPVLMAEQIGTLAAISGGPFIVQTGAGGGREQFAALGADLGRRGAHLDAGITAVQALLRGETVDVPEWGVKEARIAPVPPASTEWWVGGGVARSIDRAARLGDCWYANADLTPETAARDLDIYREACARHGRQPARIPIRKDVFVAESAVDAERHGDDLMAAGYRGFAREAVAYGDPAGVAEQLATFARIGFTDVIVRTMTAAPAPSMRSVELMGEVARLLAEA